MKTSNKLLLGALALVLIAITSLAITVRSLIAQPGIKPDGKMTTITRSVDPFSKISIEGPFTVYLTQGAQQAVKVEGDIALAEHLQTTSKNGLLTLRMKSDIESWDGLKVYITAPELEEINLHAGSKVESQGVLQGKSLKMDLSAGSHGEMQLAYSDLNTELSAGAHLELQGNVGVFRFELSAGASLDAPNLNTSDCNGVLSSGSHAEVMVSKKLDAEVSSGASLEYSGNPVLGKINVGSGGNLDKK